ncbi:uncharacterized protein GGS25DRAFT_478731 [Hypoxylon fragiforme]|uniref:uncharacterized protein n=1 Tax=Hypoxylon fragiforme TaxID=63214 RepID=UPI0020C63EAA|nr:uncharacterized protein GGS25DRAFT_478731 [Hypoxylon fragiforme]KAI2613151.1 hypothetical protein GGS25DRAFT_478731 [Hypoxylon fragiforme]
MDDVVDRALVALDHVHARNPRPSVRNATRAARALRDERAWRGLLRYYGETDEAELEFDVGTRFLTHPEDGSVEVTPLRRGFRPVRSVGWDILRRAREGERARFRPVVSVEADAGEEGEGEEGRAPALVLTIRGESLGVTSAAVLDAAAAAAVDAAINAAVAAAAAAPPAADYYTADDYYPADEDIIPAYAAYNVGAGLEVFHQ